MIPSGNKIRSEVLKFIGNNNQHHIRDVVKHIADVMNVSDEDQKQLTQVGKISRFYLRVLWSVSELRSMNYLKNSKKGIFKITRAGLDVLKVANNDEKSLESLLKKKLSQHHKKNSDQNSSSSEQERTSPVEILEESYKKLEDDTISVILTMLANISPRKLEYLVVKLLEKMGYAHGKGITTKHSHDDGIDGIVNEDEFGLRKIYLQTKRWNKQVPKKELQSFSGALDEKNATYGIFFTTSNFTESALNYPKKSGKKIVLVNGMKMAELLYKYNLGVSVSEIYEIKKIDDDFFDDLI